MRLSRYIVLATGMAAVILSVSYFTSLFAQQTVPEDPRPAALSPQDYRITGIEASFEGGHHNDRD